MAFLLLLMGGGLVGCAHVPKECLTPPPMYVTLQASKNLNPDETDKRSLPTVVRVLQLSGFSRLSAARFLDVWQQPQEVLGEDLLKVSDDIPLDPGDTVSRWIPREAKAQFVVAVAAFRKPGDMWYGAYKLGPVPEDLCVARPVAEPDVTPRPRDEHLRFVLEGYVIEPPDDSAQAGGATGSKK